MDNVQWNADQEKVGRAEGWKPHATKLLAPFPMFGEAGAAAEVNAGMAQGR